VANSILLLGGPDTGKTNYLARLWETLRSKKGRLICPNPPDDIEYVEDALSHMLQGSFAPRSNKSIDESRADVAIPVRPANSDIVTSELIVPDVNGELWKFAVETLELPERWMRDLEAAMGALLFVRVLSDLNVSPLDWVTAKKVLRRDLDIPQDVKEIPTQVVLCELLRFLELKLNSGDGGTLPRVAICVTAYDLLDKASSAAGPFAYIRKEYPLLAGRLADVERLDVKVFGISVVGGDLAVDQEFREAFLKGNFADSGYTVTEKNGEIVKDSDMTRPIAWVLRSE
jgi:hypothetical protein